MTLHNEKQALARVSALKAKQRNRYENEGCPWRSSRRDPLRHPPKISDKHARSGVRLLYYMPPANSIQGIHNPKIEHNCVLDTSPPECYSEHAFIASRATPPSIPTLAHTTLRSCPVTLQCPNQRTGRMYSHCQLERYQRPAQASEISELGWGQPMQAITVEGWRIWKRPAYLRCTPNCEVGAFLRRASLGMMRRCEGSIVC